MMQLTDLKLIDLCPSSLKNNSEIIAICEALQSEFDAVNSEIDNILFITNLENQPDDVLEHLAWERKLGSEDGWLLADTNDKKVNLIRNAYEIKRYKGTPYAIEKSLELLGITANILEWFEYDGDPYTFQISLPSAVSFTPEKIELLDSFIQQYKNTRSWVSYIQNINFDTKPYVAFATKINILMEDRK
jgi:phage tail P2-like protein